MIGISREYDTALVLFSAGWWAGAVLIGIWLGRRAETSPPIARLLATARTQTTLPELRPALTLINRLWPLLFATLGAAVLEPVRAAGRRRSRPASRSSGRSPGGARTPPSWRSRSATARASTSTSTSPLQPIQLVRTPGFGGAFLKYHP